MTEVSEGNSGKDNFWKPFDDDSKAFTENSIEYETTEIIFNEVTKFMTNSISVDIQKGSDANNSLDFDCTNTSVILEKCNLTVYSFYPTEILWFGAICCVIFSILGTAGNLISILAMLKCKRLRNATTAFIVNLCASDMLYCSFTMPLTAVTFLDRNWYNGEALCKLFALVKFSNGIVSIFTIVAITVNRYILIVYPKSYLEIYSKRNTLIIIASLWLVPLTLIFLPLFNVWGTLAYNPKVGDCGVMDLHGKSPRALIFIVALVLPIILFIACYLRIYFVVKKSVKAFKKQSEQGLPECVSTTGAQGQVHKNSNIYIDLRNKKEFRVIRIVLVIFIVYICSFFPIALLKLFRKERELPITNVFAYILYFSSSVVNPVIYIAMSREYRRAYKDLFLSRLC